MKEKLTKKYLSFLNFEWTLVWHVGILIFSVLTLVLLESGDVALSEEQIHIIFEVSPILVIIGTLLSGFFIVKFRRRVDKVFDTIKSIADGDFVVAVNTKDKSQYGAAYTNLSRVAEELRGSKEKMQQFTNEFLHEIKTPITAIHGFAEHLLETGKGIESPERMQYLKIISQESIRLSELAQKTLMLAKVDACQIVTDKTEYDLSEQIKHCIILMLAQIDEKHIELDVDIEGLRYYGNPEFMEQVWLNLIGNAIKFTPEHGEVAIKGSLDKKGITLSFTDSGAGMDVETQAHIFEKYYQGASGRKAGGNGIGLSIVYRIVKLCGGSVTVSSTENVGSTFTVFLPKTETSKKQVV